MADIADYSQLDEGCTKEEDSDMPLYQPNYLSQLDLYNYRPASKLQKEQSSPSRKSTSVRKPRTILLKDKQTN